VIEIHMSESLLLIETADPQITVLTLNRPEKRNALSIELIEKLTAAVKDVAKDPERRVIVIRGNGPSFCAGLDLKEAGDPAKSHASAEALCQMYLAIGNSPLITIAQAHGAAIGGGAGLLAACDFVIAPKEMKIGFPEVHRGLVAALVTALLRRQYDERFVRELVLLGKTMIGKNAWAMVTRVTRADTLDQAAMELAREAMSGAPGAIARSKRLLDVLAPRTLETDLKLAMEFHLQARDSAEAAEGMAAFLEKRSPRWGPRPVDGS
jgi:methylglutaconyl-CoA hydratase